MTDPALITLRDHAARMATAEHTDECHAQTLHQERNRGRRKLCVNTTFADMPGSTNVCLGCTTPADRAMWRQLADEITAYVADDAQDTLL